LDCSDLAACMNLRALSTSVPSSCLEVRRISRAVFEQFLNRINIVTEIVRAKIILHQEMARLEESYQQGLATVRRKNNVVHRSRLVFSTFCECQEELEAEWTQLFLSTSLEETLKTYARSLVCHAFLHETPPIADLSRPLLL